LINGLIDIDNRPEWPSLLSPGGMNFRCMCKDDPILRQWSGRAT
jgi:hypothetical protein